MIFILIVVHVLGLLTELEEIRAQREHLGVQADNVTRVQIKQLTEYQSNIRTLEVQVFFNKIPIVFVLG